MLRGISSRSLYSRHGWTPSTYCWERLQRIFIIRGWVYCSITVVFIGFSLISLWQFKESTFKGVFTGMAAIWSLTHYLYWRRRIYEFFHSMENYVFPTLIWEIMAYYFSSLIFCTGFYYNLWLGLQMICGFILCLYGCTVILTIIEYFCVFPLQTASQPLIDPGNPVGEPTPTPIGYHV